MVRMEMRQHHVVDERQIVFHLISFRQNTFDIAGDPVAGQPAGIRNDGNRQIKPRHSGMVAAIQQHRRPVRKNMQDGFRHACADEMNLVFAFLPAFPDFTDFTDDMFVHFSVPLCLNQLHVQESIRKM